MTASRRLQLLFLIALIGVLVCLGLVVATLAGAVAALVFALLAVGLLGVGAARARAAQQAARRAAGYSCSCCTTSQHDPVKVI